MGGKKSGIGAGKVSVVRRQQAYYYHDSHSHTEGCKTVSLVVYIKTEISSLKGYVQPKLRKISHHLLTPMPREVGLKIRCCI